MPAPILTYAVLKTAWYAGKHAAEDGGLRSSNPYAAGSKPWLVWDGAYEAALEGSRIREAVRRLHTLAGGPDVPTA